MDRKVSGAFLCLLGFSFNLSAQPFLSRDQNPLAMIHGLPFATSATLPAAGQLNWLTSYTVTNTLNQQSLTTESILLDYESHELLLSLNYGLSEDWALRLDIPLIYYGGGFLDNAIDSWHQTFGLPRANRPNVADNGFQLSYQQNNDTIFEIDQANSSLTDVQFGIGRQLFNTELQAASLWVSVDLPTGSKENLSGSENTDFILQLAYQRRLHPSWQLDTNLALTRPGTTALGNTAIAAQIWSAQTGIEWRALPRLELRAQLNGHSAIYPQSRLELLGSNYRLVFGGRVRLDSCASFDIAVSEDLKAGAAPDVSFNFSYQSFTMCK